jgi:site-specific DNA recombinase
MRIAAYVRVSTDEQVQEGYSIDAQRDRLINYCRSQDDWEIIEWYPEEGESAKDLDRPELQRLLQDSQKGLFDVVLVYRLDRLTRSVMDLYKLLEMFEKYGVKFKSATELYDTTTAMGKLFITLVAALAEWELNNLRERVRFGMEQLVREGKWHGGPVPVGFTWDGTTMHIVEEEARAMRELRRLYMSGEGFGSTAKKLNAMGYSNRGNSWSAQSVWYILDNPIYAGKIRYGGKKKNGKYASRKKEERVEVIWSDSGFPTIYSWEEYEEHTARMKKRQFYGHSKKREYWFSGVIRCARCGSTMIGRPYRNPHKSGEIKPGVVNYICSNRATSKGCTMPLLRQSVAQDLIMGHIRRIAPMSHDELVAATEEVEQVQQDSTQELEQLRKELKAIGERRKKWQYMFAEDLMTENDFRSRKREEDEKERFILDRIEEVKADEVGVSSGFAQMMYELPGYFHKLDDADKKDVMQTIFQSIKFECDVENGKEASGKGKTLPFHIIEVNFN